jgi:hypothetical protein
MTAIRWTLPQDLLSRSIEIMRPAGRAGNEGLALWMGTGDDDSVVVTHVFGVHGSGFVTSPLYLRLSFRAIAQLSDLADQRGVYLVGQIHSHPGTLVDLSDLDRIQGFRVPDFLSVVCPHYAQRPQTTLDNCGVHVFDRGDYRRLTSMEARRRIRVETSTAQVVHCEVHSD